MEILNWFNVLLVLLLLLILIVLWIIKDALESKKETDRIVIRNTRRFRQFVTQDYIFRKKQEQINREIIQELKTTYSEYEEIEELRDELLGIKIHKKEEREVFGFIFSAIFTLLVALVPPLTEIPLAILLIPATLVMVAIASYLVELYEKIRMEQTEGTIILFMIPVILTITSILIMGILLAPGSARPDTDLLDWLYKIIVIEGVFLYIILLYEKVRYISYLETVVIVLNEVIVGKDRKLWITQKRLSNESPERATNREVGIN